MKLSQPESRRTANTLATKGRIPTLEYKMKRIYALWKIGFLLLLTMFVTADAKPTVNESNFGKTSDGKEIGLFTLRNSAGAEARVITYGGTLVGLSVPDRDGRFGDVVLGFGSVADYENQQSYIGPLIGRYANRIGGARFFVDGREFKLAANNGVNNLHGGPIGFDRVVWSGKGFATKTAASVVLTYVSPDGDQGFPGNLNVKVTYSLTEKNELRVEYEATTDKATVVNLTQHAYFNLAGAGNPSILDHSMQIFADAFTPTDEGSIPTGVLQNVKGTPFDFLQPTRIGDRIDSEHEQIKFGKGYDHNWVINRRAPGLALAARVFESTTGRVLDVRTTEPGLQFYSGNFLDGSLIGKSGKSFPKRSGFCLEAQKFPDSPNRRNFASPILRKGQKYRQTTIYSFSTRK